MNDLHRAAFCIVYGDDLNKVILDRMPTLFSNVSLLDWFSSQGDVFELSFCLFVFVVVNFLFYFMSLQLLFHNHDQKKKKKTHLKTQLSFSYWRFDVNSK